MKLNVKGLVFVGFAAAVFASAAQAATGDDKKVTSLAYTEATYQKKLTPSTGISIDANNNITATGDITAYTGTAPVVVNGHAISVNTEGGVAQNGSNLVTGGQVYSAINDLNLSGNYQSKPGANDGQKVAAAGGGWEALDTDAAPIADSTKPVQSGGVYTALGGKVDANAAITGATKAKITYDSKGLVTGGADLVASDIPDISATYQATSQKLTQGTATTDQITGASITDDKYPTAAVVRKSIDLAISGASGNYQTASTTAQQVSNGSGGWEALTTTATPTENSTTPITSGGVYTALGGKVDANAAITGATKAKITYDSKGLVTGGADLVASDIPDISATYQATSQKLTQGTATTDQITGASITDDKYPTAAVVRKSIDLAVSGSNNGVVLPAIDSSTCNATTPCALVLAGDQPSWEPIQQ